LKMKNKINLNVSLRTKLSVSVILMLLAQTVFILFVIQSREVQAIYEEHKNKGILLAKNIAQENLQAFIRWDFEGVKESIERRIDEKLVYVIFYNRYNRPFVANDFIIGYEDIYQFSNLPASAKEGDSFSKSRKLDKGDNSPIFRIVEIEVPIFLPESPVKWGSIKIGLSQDDIKAEVQKTRLLLMLIGFAGLLVGVLGVAWLARKITEPIKKLLDGTVKISRGDFSLKIDIDSQDEIGNLAKSFNEMSRKLLLFKERVEVANKKLVQVEKLASIGHISTGIAHEIRNPLTSVKLNIQKLFEKNILREAEKDYLNISREGIAVIEKFIKELLNFARVSELNLGYFSIEQIIEGALKMIADLLELKEVKLEFYYQKRLPEVQVDADKIRQVILNIIQNSCEAVAKGGKIDIDVTRISIKEESKIEIKISDNGLGIPEKDIKDIFEPFYTTKAQGIGLGLAIALKIIEQHDGSIKVISQKGVGTSFEILIPCNEE